MKKQLSFLGLSSWIFKLDKKKKEDEYRNVTFWYIMETKELIMQSSYLSNQGWHYYHHILLNPKEFEKIFSYCMKSFDEAELNNYNAEQIDLLEYFKVKTYTGAYRKVESFILKWNNKDGYCFCKGKRSNESFLYYKDTELGDILEKEIFSKGYSKILKNIEKRYN